MREVERTMVCELLDTLSRLILIFSQAAGMHNASFVSELLETIDDNDERTKVKEVAAQTYLG